MKKIIYSNEKFYEIISEDKMGNQTLKEVENQDEYDLNDLEEYSLYKCIYYKIPTEIGYLYIYDRIFLNNETRFFDWQLNNIATEISCGADNSIIHDFHEYFTGYKLKMTSTENVKKIDIYFKDFDCSIIYNPQFEENDRFHTDDTVLEYIRDNFEISPELFLKETKELLENKDSITENIRNYIASETLKKQLKIIETNKKREEESKRKQEIDNEIMNNIMRK